MDKLDLKVVSLLEEMFSKYHRKCPEGSDNNWDSADGLLLIPPGLVEYFAYGNALTFTRFWMNPKQFSELSNDELTSYLTKEEPIIERDIAQMLGSAYALAKDGSNPEKIEGTMKRAQQVYNILMWRRLEAHTGETPIAQVGNPLLHIPSREIGYDDPKLGGIVEALERKQRGTNEIYESSKKTSILGYCQIHKFAPEDMDPAAVASIAFAGEKFGDHLVLINPVINEIEFGDDFATNGWFGDFGRRIWQAAPEYINADYVDKDGKASKICFYKINGGQYKVTYGPKSCEELQVTRDVVTSDMNIFNLVVGQLMQGYTPYDHFENPPEAFSGPELESTGNVRSEGYYGSLDVYYRADSRPNPTEKAKAAMGVVGQNAAHLLGGKCYVPGLQNSSNKLNEVQKNSIIKKGG